MIEDGTYDVMVVDADRDEATGVLRVEVVVTTGARKGDVVGLRATTVEGEPVELLGLPGTLTVTGGEPRLTIER